MCGRYVSPETAAIEREWHIGRHSGTPFGRRYNVAPTMAVSIVRSSADSALEIADARWGLIPAWWKQPKPPGHCFNAASEQAAVKPMWRDPYRSGRCLIPALGWYEWQAQQGRKQPYYLFLDAERPIAFAGLMSAWAPAGKEPVLSCAIMTGPASASVASIHARMPIVLRPSAHAAWLDRNLTDAAAVGKLVAAAAESELRSYPVRALVNSSRLDAAELIEPSS